MLNLNALRKGRVSLINKLLVVQKSGTTSVYSEKLTTIAILDQLVRDAIDHHVVFSSETSIDQELCLAVFEKPKERPIMILKIRY